MTHDRTRWRTHNAHIVKISRRCFGQRSTPAVELTLNLAAQYGLTIYDPQGDEVTRPHR
ncbi:hypothetical protein ACGFI9_07340 [Micromonospora sp. NPDC048930]|uniref:hypothetical protein n=1 Tax=Micromonospora sp. NPDC048930 TaxID=3364261 RepID=UPI00371382D2